MLNHRKAAVLALALAAVMTGLASAQTYTESVYVTVLHRNAIWSPADYPWQGETTGGGVRGPGNSGAQIQNLDPANSANVVPGWWPQAGGRPVPLSLPPIPPLRAANFYLPTEGTIGNGLFALIAHADQRIAAVARTEWAQTGGAVLFANSEPSTRLIVPLIACKYAGQTSYISVQNTDENAPTTAHLTFYVAGQTRPFAILDRTITAGTSTTFTACVMDFPKLFYVGYVTIEAPVPVTAQAFVNVETSDKAAFAFEGVPAEQAAQRLFVPLFRSNYYGTTGISVVNPGASAAQVTVQFTGSLGSCVGRQYRQGPATIQPGSSAVFYQGSGSLPVTGASPLPANCAGSATIEAAGGSVVAVVNDASGNPGAPTTTAAYNAMGMAQAGRQVALPLFRNRHTAAQLTTGIQGMNVGDAPAHVTFRVALSDGTEIGGPGCAGCEVTIAPGASHTWYPPGMAALPANRYGSAFLESDQPLAVIVNDASLIGAMDAAIYSGLRADVPSP